MKYKTLDIVFKTLGRIKVLGQNANANATSEQSDSRDDFVKNRGNANCHCLRAIVELRFFVFVCLYLNENITKLSPSRLTFSSL